MKPYSLFLVVTPEFVPGALVTLSSFLKHHPEEQRDVYLLHRDLGEFEKKCFETLPFRFHYLEHDQEIVERVAQLPIIPARRNRLLVLQAFQLQTEGPLLVMDADLLIQGSVDPLMELPGHLVGAGESLHLRGGWREDKTLTPGEGPPPPKALTETINTGVFRLDHQLRTKEHYRHLLDRLEPNWWSALGTDLTDQALLNCHFREHISVAPAGFNFVLQFQDIFSQSSGCTPEDCPVLHFAGSKKPWHPHHATSSSGDFVAATERWTREWLEVLAKISSL